MKVKAKIVGIRLIEEPIRKVTLENRATGDRMGSLELYDKGVNDLFVGQMVDVTIESSIEEIAKNVAALKMSGKEGAGDV